MSAAPVESGEPAEFEVQSAPAGEEAIDISAEWEGELAEQSASNSAEEAVEATSTPKRITPPSDEAVAEAVEEIRFYLANGMVEEARAAHAKFEKLVPDHSKFSAVRQEIEAALAQTPHGADGRGFAGGGGSSFRHRSRRGCIFGDAWSGGCLGPGSEIIDPEEAKPAAPAESPAVEPAHARSKPEPAGVLNEFVSDLEASLGDGFLAATPRAAGGNGTAAAKGRGEREACSGGCCTRGKCPRCASASSPGSGSDGCRRFTSCAHTVGSHVPNLHLSTNSDSAPRPANPESRQRHDRCRGGSGPCQHVW